MMAAALLACSAPVAVDGDTLRCADIGLVRLLSIDAPELAGHCRKGRRCVRGDGLAAKRRLADLVRGQRVACISDGRDRYGRLLARCEAGGIDLSCAMVQSRLAIVRYGRLRCYDRSSL